MAVEMVYRREWQLVCSGQRLGGRDSDQQSRHQAGAACDGHEVNLFERDLRGTEGFVDHAPDQLEVVTGCDLGNDAAVASVDALRRDDVGRDRSVRCDDRRARVVAAGLERKDHETVGGPSLSWVATDSTPPSLHMMSASSPVSW